MKRKILVAFSVMLSRGAVSVMISMLTVFYTLSSVDNKLFGLIYAKQTIFSYANILGICGFDVIIGKGDFLDKYKIKLEEILFLSGVLSLLAQAIAVVVVFLIYGATDYWDTLILMSSFWIRSLSLVAVANLESNFDVKKLGVIDLLSQVFYAVTLYIMISHGYVQSAIPLGMAVSALVYSCGVAYVVRLKPALPRRVPLKMISDGFLIQFNTLIWQLREASIPFFISKYSSAEYLGVYAIVNQVSARLSFVRMAVSKIALPASMHALKNNKEDEYIKKGTGFSVLAAISVCACLFAIVIGMEQFKPEKWHGLQSAFWPIAAFVVLNSTVTIVCSMMMAWGYYRFMLFFHAAFVGIYVLAMIAFGSMQLAGFVFWAEMVAALMYAALWVFSRKMNKPTSFVREMIVVYVLGGLIGISYFS